MLLDRGVRDLRVLHFLQWAFDGDKGEEEDHSQADGTAANVQNEDSEARRKSTSKEGLSKITATLAKASPRLGRASVNLLNAVTPTSAGVIEIQFKSILNSLVCHFFFSRAKV